MKRWPAIGLLLHALPLLGCSAEPSGSHREGSQGNAGLPAVVYFEPADGTTDVGPGPLAVVLSHELGGLDDAEPAAGILRLASTVEVVALPEASPVEASVSVVDVSTGFEKRIRVETGSLAPGWYGLRLPEALPPGLEWLPPVWLHDFGSDRVGARFRVGSEPSLLAIELCTEAGVTYVFFHHSEEIVAPGGKPAIAIVQQERAVVCEEADPRLPLELSCEALVPDLPTTITIGAGLTSRYGEPIEATSVVVTPDELPWAGGCRIFRP